MRTTIGILLSIQILSSGLAQPIVLEPLDTITWSVSNEVAFQEEVKTAVSFRAFGKLLGVGSEQVTVSEASYYTDPASVCAAIIKARFAANESWWGALSAPASERSADGTPNTGYVPDSSANWYSLALAHTQVPTLPTPVSAELVSYLRIGGMHAFDVKWTNVHADSSTSTYSSLLPVQEFSSGKYRHAPEWIGLNEPIMGVIQDTNLEDGSLSAHRMSDPDHAKEVHVYELFGGGAAEFPLVILMRAMALSDFPRASEVAALRNTIAAAAAGLPDDDAAYLSSAERQTLAAALTPSSLSMLDEQGGDWRKNIGIYEEISVVIDGGTFLFAGRNEGSSVTKGFIELYDDDGTLKLANFRSNSSLGDFWNDPRIWGALSSVLDEIVDNEE